MRQKPLQNLRRKGSSVVMILGLLAIAIAMSYSMMRSEVTNSQIQRNSEQVDGARQAALSGLATALRKIHKNDWGGVDSVLSGSLSTSESYEVTFATGDSSLTPSDAEYEMFPYRLTITSVGMFQDPYDSTLFSKHTVRAVVQLVPRKLADAPNGWSEIDPYTLFQWKPSAGSDFMVEVPFRLEGKVRVQSELKLCDDYPYDVSSRERLLGDLNQMKSDGLGDYRPFNDNIDLPLSSTDSATQGLLTNQLGLTLTDLPQDSSSDQPHPGSVMSYQLYPGGTTYTVPSIGTSLSNTTLEPDPVSNPLGIFHQTGRVYIFDNVTIRGTLIVNGGNNADIHIYGDNVDVQPHNLPLLEGTSQPVQLPTAIVDDDIRIMPGANVLVKGMATVDDQFEIRQSDQNSTQLLWEGRVVCQDVLIRGRNEWDEHAVWWQARLDEFLAQLSGMNPILYFPEWLEANHSLAPEPVLTVKPESSAVTYHWQDWNQPIFVPHDDDVGLRWDLVRWDDSP